jgi:mono/diheme cytochrome c family protein
MHRRVLQTLFVAATLLLTTTACDKGGDTKTAAKNDKTPADGADKAGAEAGAAEAGKVEEPKPEPEPQPEPQPTTAAEGGTPPTAEGGEAGAPTDTDGAAAEAGAEAGEKDGGDGDVKEPPPKDPPPKEPTPKDGGDTSAKIDAKSIFDGKCKSCHGADGKGDTTIGKKVNIPSLAGTKLGKDKIISVVESGVPDTKMKGYKDKLSKEEIEAVAGYVKKL